MFEYGLATYSICLFWLESRKRNFFYFIANPKVWVELKEMFGFSHKTIVNAAGRSDLFLRFLFSKLMFIIIIDIAISP